MIRIREIFSRRRALIIVGSMTATVALLSFVILEASNPDESRFDAHPAAEGSSPEAAPDGTFETEHERVRAALQNMYQPLNGRPCEIVADFRFDVIMDGSPQSQRYRATMVADGSRVWYDSKPAAYYQNDEVGVMVSTLSERIILFSPKSADRVMTEQERMAAYLSLLFDTQEHLQPIARTIANDSTLVVFVPVSDVGRDAIGDSLRVWTGARNQLLKIDVSWPEWAKTRYISVDYLSLREMSIDDSRLTTNPLDNIFHENGGLREPYRDYVIIDRREEIGSNATGTSATPEQELE